MLTTCVVLACAMGLGIGIGHFIGWSEKLELQEMYAEERETKMEELTDSLVSLYSIATRGYHLLFLSSNGTPLNLTPW